MLDVEEAVQGLMQLLSAPASHLLIQIVSPSFPGEGELRSGHSYLQDAFMKVDCRAGKYVLRGNKFFQSCEECGYRIERLIELHVIPKEEATRQHMLILSVFCDALED